MTSPGWLTRSIADVPEDDGWLGPGEREVLARLRFEKRRLDWRLGRFAAKALLARLLDEADLAAIEILWAEDGAPIPELRGRPLDLVLSLSHRAGRGLAAAAPAGLAFGCDLELIEPRSAAFIADFFTEHEAAAVARASDPALAANLVWSAKESALKALRVGLTRPTRELEVTAGPGGDLLVVDARGPRFSGTWLLDGALSLVSAISAAGGT